MARTPVASLLHPTRAQLLRNAKQPPAGGTVNFCSWQRLAEELKKSGAVTEFENVTAFVVEDGGLTIFLE